MWYELLPCYMIITACIAIPPVAAYYIQKFTQNGNPYRRCLLPDFNRDLYLRDLRLTGNPYVIQGLEKINGPGSSRRKEEEEQLESQQIEEPSMKDDGKQTKDGETKVCLPSEESSKMKLPESQPPPPEKAEPEEPTKQIEEEPIKEEAKEKVGIDKESIVRTSVQQSLGNEEEPEKLLVETKEGEPEEKKKKKKKKKKVKMDQPTE